MEFSRQEYWSGLPFPSPGDLPNPGIEARSPGFQADSLPFAPPGKPKMMKGLILYLSRGATVFLSLPKYFSVDTFELKD